MSDYIAEQYAKRMVENAIANAAQDQYYESVFEWAEDDKLDLTVEQKAILAEQVSDIMSSRIVITFN